MLKRLRIQNFAIIDEVAIDFTAGLNIISGETGAGKSILMDALLLILGARASSDLIRRGSDEATVEALFEVNAGGNLAAALDAHGLPSEDDLIVRRIVHRSGKNRIFVNGSMVSTGTLQAITGNLVDLCSQHDQQLLAKTDEQLLWIDRYGGLEKERASVRVLYQAWKGQQEALEALSTDSVQRVQRLDFLRFQIQELEEAELRSTDEDQELENELKVLGNAEALFAFAAEAEAFLFGSDAEEGSPALDRLGAMLNRARILAATDPKLSEAEQLLNTLKVHSEELGFFLRSYSQRVSRDEARLEEINSRLALLTKLKRKYGPALADVIQHAEEFRRELALLENHDDAIDDARSAAAAALELFRQEATKLSRDRAVKAQQFSRAVMAELASLNMDRARFSASLTAQNAPTPTGLDSARFEIAANPGEPMGPLNKVASGGELSRMMLAMHNVVSSRGDVGVYLFDEVDTGIGGKTAVVVGSKLQHVARSNQVICITHLPQVAAFANRHLRVEKLVRKKDGEDRTITKVVALEGSEREFEIGRMLGGLGNDKAALANARAMLASAAKTANSPPPATSRQKSSKSRSLGKTTS